MDWGKILLGAQELPIVLKVIIAAVIGGTAIVLIAVLFRPPPPAAPDSPGRSLPSLGETPAQVNSSHQSGGQTAQTIYNYSPAHERQAEIACESATFFFVDQGQQIYQVGVSLKLFNRNSATHLVTGVLLDPIHFAFDGGAFHPTSVLVSGVSADNRDDQGFAPNTWQNLKMLLPIKIGMRGVVDLPALVFSSPITIRLAGSHESNVHVVPARYGVYRRVLSASEWLRMPLSGPGMLMDGIEYKRTPVSLNFSGPLRNLILFNVDRTAEIDAYGFTRTNYVRNERGTLVMLKGHGLPTLESGWELLANGYQELFADPRSMEKYEAVYPRNASGELLALDAGFAAGDHITIGPFSETWLQTHGPFYWDVIGTMRDASEGQRSDMHRTP